MKNNRVLFFFFGRHQGVIALTLLFLIFGINFSLRYNQTSPEMDEYAWFYSTYYYHLAFEQKDLSSPDWQDFDAIDHPPLAKYLFGFFGSFKGLRVDSLDLKKWWHKADKELEQFEAFVQANRRVCPVSNLFMGRFFSTLTLFLASVLFYITSRRALSPFVSFVSTLLFSTTPLVLLLSVQMVSDGLFILLMMIVLALLLHWSGRFREGKSLWLPSVFLGIILALLFLTKISGIFSMGLVGLVLLGCLLQAVIHKKDTLGSPGSWKNVVGSGILILFVFSVLTYALNPSLYDDPIGFLLQMFKHRSNRLSEQMTLVYEDVLPTFSLSFTSWMGYRLFGSDWLYRFTNLPFFLFLFVIGLLKVPFYYQKNRPSFLVFSIYLGLWAFASIATFRMNWPRYLMPSIPFVTILMAMGFEELVSGFKNLVLSRKELIRNALAGILLCVFLYGFYFQATRDSFEEAHPDWVVKAEAKKWEKLLQLYPERYHHVVTLHRLAELKDELGEKEASKGIRNEIFQILKE